MADERRALVVTGDRLFADSARVLLEQSGWRVEAAVGDGFAAIALVDRSRPDAVLLTDDIGRLDASQVATLVRQRHPETNVVLVGARGAPEAVVLPRSADAATVLAALASPASPRASGGALRGGVERLAALTKREREVLLLLVDGLEGAEIAQRLSVSPHTTRTHLQRLYRKLECHSRTEVVAFAARVGLIRPPEAPPTT